MRFLILFIFGICTHSALANDFAEEAITIQIAVNLLPTEFASNADHCQFSQDINASQCAAEFVNEVSEDGQAILRVVPI